MIRLLFILLIVVVPSFAQNRMIPAFPGAEGFGKYASGGRGGKVHIVRNLNDSGPGSFREAVNEPGPRIILFAISGTIALESAISINEGDVTIAGQSAPGDGICIKNFPVSVNANNVIIRYMRFRLGDECAVEADAFGGTGQDNIIIDHCSVSWSTDECASFYRNSNFTMQWCIISESLNQCVHSKGAHGYGGIWGGMKATFHHNLLASHNSRLPRFSGSSTTPNNAEAELVDFRNNVIYNWMTNNTYGGELGRYNMVNNYYKPGPATKKIRQGQIVNPSAPLGRFYVAGNSVVGNAETSMDNWNGGIRIDDGSMEGLRAEQPFDVEPVPFQTSVQAYQSVLDHAGASLRRDAVDTRIIEDVKSGKSRSGKLMNGIIDSQQDVGGWPVLNSTSPPPDLDGDGMADQWEIARKLNPADRSDASEIDSLSGYSNIELFIHEVEKTRIE